MLTVGSLFAGCGCIELALSSVLDVRPAWFVEFDKAPSKVLAHHWPDVPNLGDVTKVDWSAVPRVDVITGGSPCQDLSHAGKRKGMTDGTRSNLWAEMREAVAVLRPRLVVWENVRGAYSAHADSDLEPCAGCVGGDGSDGEPVLRALGRVLGDLSELGYDANWYGLRAADVGAPHGRFRVFLFAQPADADVSGLEGLGGSAGASQTGRHGHAESRPGRPDLTLLPTPTSSDTNGAGAHGTGGPDLRTAVSLLPTPSAEHRDRSTATATATAKLDGSRDFRDLGSVAELNRWGDYAPAIVRWEAVLGRIAPSPTEPNAKGGHRLPPRLGALLMGGPAAGVVGAALAGWTGC